MPGAVLSAQTHFDKTIRETRMEDTFATRRNSRHLAGVVDICGRPIAIVRPRCLAVRIGGPISFLIAAFGCVCAIAQETGNSDPPVGQPQETPPISVESEQTSPPPTEQQLRRRLRETLTAPQAPVQARELDDGTLEITTKLAHLCAKPTPPQSPGGPGGNIVLAAPCTRF